MKKLLFAILLACSFSAFADYTQDWNRRFSELNNVPLNQKWTPSGQQAYLRQLMASKPDYFKNPDDYRLPVAPIPPAPYVPSVAQNETTVTNNISLQDALKSAQATVKAIENLIARGI